MAFNRLSALSRVLDGQDKKAVEKCLQGVLDLASVGSAVAATNEVR